MRRPGLVVVLLALVAVPAADAKTLKVNWREQKVLESGGALKFHVTKIVATPRSWAVTATVTNASPAAVDVDADGTPLRLSDGRPYWTEGFALIHDEMVAALGFPAHHVWLQFETRRATPAFPKSLAAGASWTGTFGGSGKLRRGKQYRIGFGTFTSRAPDAGGRGVMWITDHGFTL